MDIRRGDKMSNQDMFKISVTIGSGETWHHMEPCKTGLDSHSWKIEDIAKDEQLIKILFESAFREACKEAIEAYSNRYKKDMI